MTADRVAGRATTTPLRWQVRPCGEMVWGGSRLCGLAIALGWERCLCMQHVHSAASEGCGQAQGGDTMWCTSPVGWWGSSRPESFLYGSYLTPGAGARLPACGAVCGLAVCTSAWLGWYGSTVVCWSDTKDEASTLTVRHTAKPLSCSDLRVSRQSQGRLMPGLHRTTPFAQASSTARSPF